MALGESMPGCHLLPLLCKQNVLASALSSHLWPRRSGTFSVTLNLEASPRRIIIEVADLSVVDGSCRKLDSME